MRLCVFTAFGAKYPQALTIGAACYVWAVQSHWDIRFTIQFSKKRIRLRKVNGYFRPKVNVQAGPFAPPRPPQPHPPLHHDGRCWSCAKYFMLERNLDRIDRFNKALLVSKGF